MEGLFKTVRKIKILQDAWQKIRKNGLSSSSDETFRLITAFDENPFRNLRTIQDQLREGRFRFRPQTGIAKKRRSKLPRPLVLAPIENRIVQRAILDVLQSWIPAV